MKHASSQMPCLILIHEPESHWSAELAREFADCPEVVLRWRPYMKELLAELESARLVLFVVPPDNESLDVIRDVRARCPRVAVGCLLSSPNMAWEWLARELGVDMVLPGLTEKTRIADSISHLLLLTARAGLSVKR